MSSINISTLIQGGLVLVAAGAWNETGHNLIDYLYPKSENPDHSVIASLVYSVIVSLIVLMTLLILNSLTQVVGGVTAVVLHPATPIPSQSDLKKSLHRM